MHLVTHYPYYARRARTLPYSLLARISGHTCFGYERMKLHFEDKIGLEFGGPSAIFGAKRLIPVYASVRRIDQCNFSERTIWHPVPQTMTSTPSQLSFLAEASDLSCVGNESYDCVLASHVLEHIANPLRALAEWKRILRPGGVILLVVPHKAGMFDHRRPFSTLAQIEDDYRRNVGEDDLTHLQEILELHDLTLDPAAGTAQQFRERCLNNVSVRAMHHHVLSPTIVVQMFDYLNMEVLNVAIERPYHIIVLARTVDESAIGGVKQRNSHFLAADAEWQKRAALAS